MLIAFHLFSDTVLQSTDCKFRFNAIVHFVLTVLCVCTFACLFHFLFYIIFFFNEKLSAHTHTQQLNYIACSSVACSYCSGRYIGSVWDSIKSTTLNNNLLSFFISIFFFFSFSFCCKTGIINQTKRETICLVCLLILSLFYE